MKRKRNSLGNSCAAAPAIGIDLGTTFSSVAVYRNGRAEIIPTKDGDRRIPSIVYFDPETGAISVGRKAKELMEECPENAITDAKRIIGRKYDDNFVSSYSKSKHTIISLVQTSSDRAGFQVTISGSKVVKMPEQITAELLKYLKNIASDYLGTVVREAVVSVPAYFSIAQKSFTKEAAELAGLKVLRLVTEPAAAAAHYVSLRKQNKDGNILVFDFGGGVLDVSVIKISDKTVEVKAVNGDTLLGGKNFDDILFDYFSEDFLSRSDKATPKDKNKLINMCTNLKEALSFQEHVPNKRNPAGCLSMTPEKFEQLSKDIFQRCLEIVKLCLSDGGLSKSDIDNVILIGKSTKIPKIIETLKTYFNGKLIHLNSSLDEAVAAGASILAASLHDKQRQQIICSIKDVTPQSLGFELAEKYMWFLFNKNSPLPTEVTDTVTTASNNESQLRISIYEGERMNAAYNNHVMETTIGDFPVKRAGEVVVEISFALDEDGLLTAEAFEESTRKKLTINMKKFGLSERSIRRTVKQKMRNKKEDDLYVRYNDTRRNYQKRCHDICYEISKISQYSDRLFVDNACKSFVANSNKFQFTEMHKLKSECTISLTRMSFTASFIIKVKSAIMLKISLNLQDPSHYRLLKATLRKSFLYRKV